MKGRAKVVRLLPALGLLLLAGGPAHAGGAMVQEYDPEGGPALQQLVTLLVVSEPSHTPDSKQPEVASSSSVSPALVDRAGFTSLLSAALDGALGAGGNDQAITLQLNLFGLVAAKDSTVLDSPTRYAQYSAIRRLAVAVTLGGKADEGSVAASGTTDSSRRKNITDIVHFQGKYRILGSRDRRDHWSGDGGYMKTMSAHQDAAMKSFEPLFTAPQPEELSKPGVTEKLKFDYWLAYLNHHPGVAAAMKDAVHAYNKELDGLNERIDNSFLLTLQVTGDVRSKDNGQDKLVVELIGESATGGIDFTGNLSYMFAERDGGQRDAEAKLAAGVATKLLRASAVSREGIDLSFNLAGQVRNHGRGDIFSLNTKLDFPLANGLKIPLSLTWANRSDLVKEKIVRGNFGLSYDLSALTGKSGS